MTLTRSTLVATVTPLALLAGCGSGGGGVASVPLSSTAGSATTGTAAPVAAASIIDYDTPEYRRSNGAAQAQAIAAYATGATGSGVVVGVIDSGVDSSSSEFTGRISTASRDFAGSRGIGDEGGHGTAVAAIAVGARNALGTQGVAFDATLLALRTDRPGSCSGVANGADGSCAHTDNVIAAALDGAVAARARVVNISLGGTPANNTLRAAIDRATTAGTILVIAAGNDGMRNPALASDPDALAMIANDPISRGLVIVAGAVDANGALADFSNRAGSASATYLAALGVGVRSIDNTGQSYLFSGTSFSAPVISGAVALVAQAFPMLTPTQIVDLLLRTATDRGEAGVDAQYGRGELNLARAFQPQGTMSLAGGVPVALTGNATLGSAMGDAGQGGLAASVTDSYGRPFALDLAPTLQRSGTPSTLSPALVLATRSMGAVSSRASITLSISERRNEPLLLDARLAGQARVLAGAVGIALSTTTRLGFALGREAEGLTRADPSPAFLIGDRSLDRVPRAAFALRHGKTVGVTIATETGDLRLWQREIEPRLSGERRYRYAQLGVKLDAHYGPISTSIGVTRMHERATVLGSRFSAALGGGEATTWFADAAIAAADGDWRLTASIRQGWTRLGANAVRGGSTLVSRALSGQVERRGLLAADDSLALRYAEPLRVTDGGLLLKLGAAPQTLGLAPTGGERDLEAVYTRPLALGDLAFNAYLRRQPGNIATAPNDLGGALRWSTTF